MKTILTYSVLFVSVWAFAQKKDRHLAKGNEALAQKQYAEAEVEYRLSQNVTPGKAPATYNLGNTIYTLDLPEEAGFAFKKAIKEAKTYTQKHRAYHNLGNVLMKLKNYQGAVEAYKQALINNPKDEETRYNYALARLYLKNNPPKNGGGKDDKKDQKKDQKDQQKQNQQQNKQNKQDKKDQGDQNKDQQKQPGDKQKDQGQGDQPKPQPRPQGASKQRIENILNAINNEEKKVQDKVKEKAKAQPVQPEKDW